MQVYWKQLPTFTVIVSSSAPSGASFYAGASASAEEGAYPFSFMALNCTSLTETEADGSFYL